MSYLAVTLMTLGMLEEGQQLMQAATVLKMGHGQRSSPLLANSMFWK
jgi:hypothetical protein